MTCVRKSVRLSALLFFFTLSPFFALSLRADPIRSSLGTVAPPVIQTGTERPLSPPVPGPAPMPATLHAVSAEGGFVAVWTESMIAFSESTSAERALYIRRLDREGRPLDTLPKLVTTGPIRLVTSTSIAGETLIFWISGHNLYGARLPLIGEPFLVKPIVVYVFPSFALGSEWLLIDSTSLRDSVVLAIHGVGDLQRRTLLLDVDATIRLRHVVYLDPGGAVPRLALASDGEAALLLQQSGSLISTRWKPGTEPVTTAFARSTGHFTLIFNGRGFEVPTASGQSLDILEINREGSEIVSERTLVTSDRQGFAHIVAARVQDRTVVALAESIGHNGCFPSCDPGIYQLRQFEIATDGTVREAAQLGEQTYLSPSVRLASNGNVAYLAWSSRTVFGHRLDRPQERRFISEASPYQLDAAVTEGAGTWVAAWAESHSHSGPWSIVTGRVSSRGLSLDGPGIAIAQLTDPAPPVVKIASDGTRFLVVWSEGLHEKRLSARFVSADGKPSVQAFSPGTGTVRDFDLTWNGESFVLFTAEGKSVTSRIISSDGVPQPARVISVEDTFVTRVSAVRRDGDVLVAWLTRSLSHDLIRTIVVSIDMTPRSPVVTAGRAFGPTTIGTASLADGWAVFWIDAGGSTTLNPWGTLQTQPLTPQGLMLPGQTEWGTRLSHESLVVVSASASRDGDLFWATSGGQVFGLRNATTKTFLNPPVAPQVANGSSVASATAGPGGTVLLVYRRATTGDPLGATVRNFHRILDNPAPRARGVRR